MRAYRSPIRLFAFGVVGIVLIVAAIDVLFVHEISTPPEANEGVLSTRGLAQQRGDIVWGAALIGIGTLLAGGAVVELVRRRPLAAVDAGGIALAIGHREHEVRILWENVRAVSSDVVVDPYDGSTRELLLVDVFDRDGLPDTPVGGEWVRNELRIDAHDWTTRVTDIALSAQGALDHHRRVEAIQEMEAPSLTWETTVAGEEEDDE
ncbi:MAG: hypothetical protein ACR2N7_10565 [Acidimicrobiia bacterium]